MTVTLRAREIAFYMRNVRTRMPFRYGVATLTSVPILHMSLTAELADGTIAQGFAADILPPKWFDKDPAKDYQENIEDLLFVARHAADTLSDLNAHPTSVFALWRQVYDSTLAAGDERGLNHLTAAHGSTLVERAMIDAVGRGTGQSYHEMLISAENPLGIDLGGILPALRDVSVADIVSSKPSSSVAIRHTVGLTDPIQDQDIATDERLDDGLPQSLAAYIQTQGLTHFKVKIQGNAEHDLERLRQIAAVVKPEDGCVISLDGNEQYTDLDPFEALLARLKQEIPDFYRAISYIEQPLERSVALESAHSERISRISREIPMIVDESDGDLDTFQQAVSMGYRGVSTKNCKGLFKALANMALVRQRSTHDVSLLMTAEDLMNLPVVPLHQDLAHIAALGLDHAERNGHHYVRGLDHLTQTERDAVLRAHSSLYQSESGGCRLAVDSGRIDLRSLQVPGLGVGPDTVDPTSMTPLSDWRFETL